MFWLAFATKYLPWFLRFIFEKVKIRKREASMPELVKKITLQKSFFSLFLSFFSFGMSLHIDYESSSDEEQVGQKRKTETVLKERFEQRAQTNKEKKKCSPDVSYRSKMPKLPSFFDTAQQLTLQAQHKGKIRTVPHRENSWATYVYFKVDLDQDKKSILKYCKALEEIPEQHVSLSRTVYLKEHQLESFVAAIKARMQDHTSFRISFAQLAKLTNDEKTRSFLTLEISKGYNEVSGIYFVICR